MTPPAPESLPSTLNRIFLVTERIIEILQGDLDGSISRARQLVSGDHDATVDAVDQFAEATRKLILAAVKDSGLAAARKRQREYFHQARQHVDEMPPLSREDDV